MPCGKQRGTVAMLEQLQSREGGSEGDAGEFFLFCSLIIELNER